MNKIQLHLIAFVFAAFLPPKQQTNPDEEDYYSILNLSKSCTQEDIRKAYKKKSLQYHPDKVAQFASTNKYKNKTPAEIQADFVKIKEAYETLSDVQKRNAYDVLGPTGGKLFNAYQENGMIDPNQIMINLATANYVDKTKLFLLVFLLISMLLIGPILICVKADSVFNHSGSLLDTKWVWILIPIWILEFLFLLLGVISQAWFLVVKTICIIVLEVFLAMKWDEIITWDYVIVLIPLILHQWFLFVECIFVIREVHKDVARMVTVSYLEEKILPTFRMDNIDQPDDVVDEAMGRRYYNDLSEDEKEYINKLYIIVDQIDDDVYGQPQRPADDDNNLDPEVKLLFEVVKSQEFQHASHRQNKARQRVIKLFLTRVPFLILLILQLDLNQSWDWNLVFCTIWIEVCFNTLSNCFICCCTGVVAGQSDNVEVYHENENDDVEKGGQSDVITGNAQDTANDSVKPTAVSAFGNDHNEVKEEEETKNESSLFESVSFSPLLGKDDNETTNKNDNQENANISVNDDEAEHEEHDEHADIDSELVQRRSEAAGNCFNNMISIIFLALFTVKLNGAYDGIDGTASYSSIWIIFPILFFAGLILCSCACCIYARITPDKLESVMSRRSHTEGGAGSGDAEEVVSDPKVVNDVDNGDDSDDLD